MSYFFTKKENSLKESLIKWPSFPNYLPITGILYASNLLVNDFGCGYVIVASDSLCKYLNLREIAASITQSLSKYELNATISISSSKKNPKTVLLSVFVSKRRSQSGIKGILNKSFDIELIHEATIQSRISLLSLLEKLSVPHKLAKDPNDTLKYIMSFWRSKTAQEVSPLQEKKLSATLQYLSQGLEVLPTRFGWMDGEGKYFQSFFATARNLSNLSTSDNLSIELALDWISKSMSARSFCAFMSHTFFIGQFTPRKNEKPASAANNFFGAFSYAIIESNSDSVRPISFETVGTWAESDAVSKNENFNLINLYKTTSHSWVIVDGVWPQVYQAMLPGAISFENIAKYGWFELPYETLENNSK